ncbi:hypothetical protein [Halorubellus sp. PRR65]|uniref:hypothetical protein n=1 Tax=Halorubellus sp. PRR65 TaxID=3098148 RepID=UPI002B2570EE|nr:hypothetical protein [Halorubellus sp. PRR65]
MGQEADEPPHEKVERVRQAFERIGRRELLVGTGVAAFGWHAIPIPGAVDRQLTREENRLEALSEKVDETDLRDPRGVLGLSGEIRDRVQSVKSTLSSDSVEDGEVIAGTQRDLSEVLSGDETSSDDRSRTARRIATLQAGVQYYESLLKALQASSHLQQQLGNYEITALYNTGTLTRSPPGTFQTDHLQNRVEEIERIQDVNTDAVDDQRLSRLLPATDVVRTEVTGQVEIFETFRAAQRSYLQSGAKIEAGARHHEQSKLDKAKSKFVEANRAATVEIREDNEKYTLRRGAVSLGDYKQIFKRRRNGIEMLIKACDTSKAREKRENAFNKGLDHLFQARRIIRA